MKTLATIDTWLKVDLVFFRVCFVLMGVLIASLLFWVVLHSPPEQWWAWLVAVFFTVVGLALALLGVAASDTAVDRALDFTGEGGDLLVVVLFVLLGVAAVPITMLVRSLRQNTP